jgi:fucose permease
MKNSKAVLVPLLVVMSLMFIWNLSRNINDILIPHLKRACELTDFQSSLIQSAFFGGYFLLALPVGQFIGKYGYKAGMVTGLLTAAVGAFLFFRPPTPAIIRCSSVRFSSWPPDLRFSKLRPRPTYPYLVIRIALRAD